MSTMLFSTLLGMGIGIGMMGDVRSIFITRLQIIPTIHAFYFASTKILSKELLDGIKIQSYTLLSTTNNLHIISNTAVANEISSLMLYLFFIKINNYYYNKDKIHKFQQIGYFKESVNATKVGMLIIFFTLIRNVDRAI